MAEQIWQNIGPLDNVPLRGARRLCYGGRPVAIFRTGDDGVFALIDECPHRKGPLSEGIVSGTTVTCPLHNWSIDLDSGKAVSPDEGAVERIPVRLADGDIHIALPPAGDSA